MSVIRRFVEHASRNRVVTKRLPKDFGGIRFCASPDAALSFWKQGVESDLFDYAREFVHPGHVVWDIGANVGLFTFSAAQRAGLAGNVVAVEADIWLAELLNRSATMQPEESAPISVLSAAVFDSMGIASFCIANRGRASNFLAVAKGNSQTGGVRATNSVVTITLDWLLEQGPQPDVVKIDVEGAELNVLKGGLRLLHESHPVLLCEVSHVHARDEVTSLLIDCGYTLFDWGSPQRERVQRCAFNTLALPPKLA